jgi:hypothetical protein
MGQGVAMVMKTTMLTRIAEKESYLRVLSSEGVSEHAS